jgi:hypothetical protein
MTKKWFIISVAVIILILIGLNFVGMPPLNEQAGFSIPTDYSEIFNDSAKGAIKVDICYNSPVRNSVAILDYKNRYQILLYKFRLNSRLPLKALVIPYYLRQTKSFRTYYGHTMNEFDFNYLLDSGKLDGNIYFTLYGDSMKRPVIKDSVFTFHIKFRSIEFMNSDKAHTFFYINKGRLAAHGYCEVDFVKKGETVFFLLVTPVAEDEDVVDNFASEILN